MSKTQHGYVCDTCGEAYTADEAYGIRLCNCGGQLVPDGQYDLEQPQKVKLDRTMLKVRNWSTDRNLNTADPIKQMLKLTEETGELAAAMARGKTDAIHDAVGDILVVLTVLCQQLHISLPVCYEAAYQTIKNRTGRMVDGVFVKDEDRP